MVITATMTSWVRTMVAAPDTRLYELDRPELLALKDEQLQVAGATPRCARIAVSVDLTAAWSSSLRDAGFRPQSPTLWLVEGLLYFLDGDQLHALLQEISDLSTPGSWILADFVTASSLASPSMRPWLDRNGQQRPCLALGQRPAGSPVREFRLADDLHGLWFVAS
ncbi:SAM-dependent methyltransferase [Actinoplanes sp. NPDC026670]|uniref:SAM-dependent methyltransferase n=1 Tax=Actinoplanes sp. NPDC026670 TaxID=3154700 RepID=UPI0034043D46